MAQHSGMQTCNLPLRRMSHVFMMEMVVVWWYPASFESFKYISLIALGKPSIKKTIFLLTFVNKRGTPEPQWFFVNN